MSNFLENHCEEVVFNKVLYKGKCIFGIFNCLANETLKVGKQKKHDLTREE